MNAAKSSSLLTFPTSVFPKPLREYIEHGSSQNYPDDFVGAALLACLATAIGASHELEVNANWHEPTTLFIAIVGDAGVRKSSSLNYAMKAIRTRQKQQIQAHMLAIQQYDEQMRQAKANKDSCALPELPSGEQTIVEDATVEALIGLLAQNPRGLLNFRDELASWTRDLNRYRAGSDEQRWLSLWSAGSITYNRKTQAPLFVERPVVSVLGGLQPAVLSEVFGQGKSENGFSDRVLFAYPNPIARCVVKVSVPITIREAYASVFERLFALSHISDGDSEYAPHLIPLDHEARAAFEQWSEDYINRKINDPNTPAREKGVLSKLEAYLLRFALILHITAYVCKEEGSCEAISASSICRAMRLVEYFKSHYDKIAASSSPLPDTDKVINWIREKGGTVTKRDIYRAKVGGLDTQAKATAFILDHVGLGVLVAEEVPQKHGGPSQTVVHLLI
ncbi:DUF3987 domain-containing protein [Hymenobacter sp. B1770]|uniref:DUF3987 domain-containing protein n=1 Tax=Hymenobacter sp. B1770 TaxID=1718788 RepID=UPI003CEF7BE7